MAPLPFGINNFIPSSMRSECAKCGRILASFIDPRQSFGPDKIIPPEILANAKGLAILTVLKAGFIGSGRLGSGVIVARRADGSWGAPSAIVTAGGGFGGQIGFELTDFVFILNDWNSVKTFAQAGSLTVGGNVSIAAGPVGRNAEAAGGVSMKGVGGVFAYSKTKGLFAGVSLEGGGFAERRDANEKMYGQRYKASQLLLEGVANPPPAADPLMRVLETRVFTSGLTRSNTDMYNDIPVYDESHEDVIWQGSRGSAYGEGVPTNRTGSAAGNEYEYRDSPTSPKRANTWQDDVYDRDFTSPGMSRSQTGRASNLDRGFTSPGLGRSPTSRANPSETFDSLDRRSHAPSLPGAQDYVYSDRPASTDYSYSDNKRGSTDYSYSDKPKPSRPTAPKPVFSPQKTGTVGPNQKRAKFTFEAEQEGDLGFKKGDVVTIIKRTDKADDWWTGRLDGRTGTFPSNYLEPS